MPDFSPLLLVGAGRLGSALIEGWRRTGAFQPRDLIILDPQPGESARKAAEAGASLNPPVAELLGARTVVLAVKPQAWRAAAAELEPHLAREAVVVSVAAGVRTLDLQRAFGGRAVARTLPTTAVAVGQGACALYAADPQAAAAAHAVFDPVARTVDLNDEAQMDSVIGICGSAPGFFYAFIEALEAAGIAEGLPPEVARPLARAAVAGAGALMQEMGAEPAGLRRQVASPAGTTEAGLNVLMRAGALPDLLREAVTAAAERSRELGG
ncbi:MAG TPA: pyrroline-5-carboxylate reductase [Caulobacteraceae bacterium]|jgi:pyrroline-5-carboxylate reductase